MSKDTDFVQAQRQINESYIAERIDRDEYLREVSDLHALQSRETGSSRCVCPACTEVRG